MGVLEGAKAILGFVKSLEKLCASERDLKASKVPKKFYSKWKKNLKSSKSLFEAFS